MGLFIFKTHKKMVKATQTSNDVFWGLTKKNSCFIVRQKGAKARGDSWSSDPCNNTGFHNASSQGYTRDHAYGLSAEKSKSKAGKGARKQFNYCCSQANYR